MKFLKIKPVFQNKNVLLISTSFKKLEKEKLKGSKQKKGSNKDKCRNQ